jgi:hypothetical protein
MIKRVLAAALAVSACITLAGTTASARSVGGDAMDPIFDNPDCWNGVPAYNYCSTAQSPWWDLTVDNTGAKSVTVYVKAASASANVQCAAWGVSSDYSTVTMSSVVSATVFGSVTPLTMSGVTVPSNGTLWVDCSVGPASSIYTLTWNQ